MKVKDYLNLFEIPFDIEKNIGVSGYKPSEKDIDNEYFTRNDYEYALQEYEKQNKRFIQHLQQQELTEYETLVIIKKITA